jgi:hypothetical protein
MGFGKYDTYLVPQVLILHGVSFFQPVLNLLPRPDVRHAVHGSHDRLLDQFPVDVFRQKAGELSRV